MLITWGEGTGLPGAVPCLACGSLASKPHVLRTMKTYGDRGPISFYRCPDCGSVLANVDELASEDEAEVAHEESWRRYVQIGAGLDAMVRPLEQVRVRADASLLDVGCGLGFTLDYWTHLVGAPAVGVEPSGWGRRGVALLGADIKLCLLEDATDLRDRYFDLLLSSEVIEHVPDPLDFLRQLKARLTPGGVVVLTTPAAEFVQPGNGESPVLAALSPGLHRVLFSQSALERVLQDAGFGHAVVQQERERLVAWASDAPVLLADEAALRPRYIEYLVRRARNPDLGVDLQLGFGYRAFKELVNEGRVPEAQAIGDRLHNQIARAYALDITDADGVRARIMPLAELEDYEDAAPYALGSLLFYRAMAIRNGAWHGEAPEAAFDLAHEVLSHSIRIAPGYFQEAATLIGPTVAEAAVCAAESNDPSLQDRLAALRAQPGLAEAYRTSILLRVLTLQVNAGRYDLARDLAVAAGLGMLPFAQPGGTVPLSTVERDALFCLAVLDVQAEGGAPGLDPAAGQERFARLRTACEPGTDLWWGVLRGEMQAMDQRDAAQDAAALVQMVQEDYPLLVLPPDIAARLPQQAELAPAAPEEEPPPLPPPRSVLSRLLRRSR